MKKLFLFLVFFSVVFILNSQITKGNWLVGGGGEYTNQTFKFDDGEELKREYITIKPSAGYFLKDKFALGSALRFEKNDIFYNYGIGFFTRYYFLKKDKPFNLFAQLHYDFVLTYSDIDSYNDSSVSSNFYGARVGQVIFFNNIVALEFALVYEKGEDQNSKSNTFKAVVGFQIHLEKK